MHIVYRVSQTAPTPFVGIRQIFAPFVRKRGVRIESFSRERCLFEKTLKTTFILVFPPFEPLLIELQQLPPVFLFTFPLEIRPNVSSTLLRHRYSRFNRALSPKIFDGRNLYSRILYIYKRK